MHKIRGISIPEDAAEKYNEEYFKQLGIDTAHKVIALMQEKLDELNGK